MPNQITATGLQVATRSELVAQFTTAMQAIYGPDINLGSDTPDGQMMNIYIQSMLDLEDLLVQICNGFDPDLAIGNILDQRVAINGIQRQGGTPTITNISIVTTQALNLYGLNQTDQPVYTVADNAGNQWQLINTQMIGSSGTYSLAFQSAVPGAVLTIPNTITVPVTIVLGVDSINNPNTYTSLGTNEETDFALKIRRQISVSLPSQGYLAGLLAALENISGLTFAFVEENNTGSTNADGVPGHSIWVIVAGAGTNADIANAIYTKRNAGCGLYNISGLPNFSVVQADGSLFPVFWDVVVAVNLFVKFTATSLDGINPPNIAAIRSGLAAIYEPGVAKEVNINQLATFVQQIDPNTLVTSAGFSLSSGGSYTNTLTPAQKNKQFVVIPADTIILTMILDAPGVVYVFSAGAVTETTIELDSGGTTLQFTGLGGFGTLTYSILSGAGSVNSSSGLYMTATAGTDVVQVTDSLGNVAQCTVTVI